MFFGKPSKATPLKKFIYLVAFTVLCFLLGIIVYSVVEINYFAWVVSQGKTITMRQNDLFSPLFMYSLLVIGGFLGFFAGKYCWRKIYVQRVWCKKKL